MASQEHATLENLVPKIQDIVQVYRDQVLGAIGNCIKECDEVFLREVKKVSPYNANNKSNKHYKDCWTVKSMKRAKFVSYIGNTKKVKARAADSEPTIPLINILEYSSKRAQPHVNKALDNSKDEVINLIISNIGKVGK